MFLMGMPFQTKRSALQFSQQARFLAESGWLGKGSRSEYGILGDGGALPFHAMSRYPYPANENYPNDAAHDRYRREYNTRPALRLIRPLGPS